MFRVTRYPMISKTESGRVGYWQKYRVAGRVRVPAGHWYWCICQEWSSVFHQRTVPKKISSICVHLKKKRLVFCSLNMWSKSCKACIAQQHTAHYQVFFNLNMKMDAEMGWQNFWWLTFKCLTFLSHCLLPSGHHNLLNCKKKKIRIRKTLDDQLQLHTYFARADWLGQHVN